MKFLVDECLSPRLAQLLRDGNPDAVHVIECGLAGAPDEDVLARAVLDDRVLISADTDFGQILARTRQPAPSVVLFRRRDRSSSALIDVLVVNLDSVEGDLAAGAFVVMTDEPARTAPSDALRTRLTERCDDHNDVEWRLRHKNSLVTAQGPDLTVRLVGC